MKSLAIAALAASVAFLVTMGTSLAAGAAKAPAYTLPNSAVHSVEAGDRAYRLYVVTPPGYDAPKNAQRRYPVIYLNDGDLFFAAAAGAPLLSYYNGLIEETILVGISYAEGDDPLASRRRDFTPVRDESLEMETGGGADYLAAFKNNFIPMIEGAYRADPSRRTLAGHSFGALFGLYALLSEPALFANYIIVSPSLWYGDNALARLEATYADGDDALPALVYMAVGDLEGPKGGLKTIDMVGDEIAFAARLRSRGYADFELKDEILDGGVGHAAAFPIAYMRALIWLFPAR